MLKVERTGKINAYIEHAVRCRVLGYKARGKQMFPNMSTVHDVLTAHLMCPLMFCPYI